MKAIAITAILGLGLALSARGANAAFLNTSGTWTNTQPVGSINGENTNTISWGTGGTSSYVFDGVSETVDINDLINAPFLLGQFTHNNFPIFDPVLQSATLNVDLSLDSFSQTFLFDFTHLETPNNASPCEAGGVQPCPDLVSFPNEDSSQFITLDGVDYKLTLIGFSQNGLGNAVDEFLTIENQSNTANLFAQLTEVETENVPEPLTILGSATALGIGALLKRESSKKQKKS
ncbi:THxN family PEP-CTERM protein [Coleofasciculus chthonoplastes]|uniref:THxN family PEP-CTERM protein n=1 Tax=Coleofasciculus chthonoplastes TaxID=64178 RepID=UPI0032FA1D04